LICFARGAFCDIGAHRAGHTSSSWRAKNSRKVRRGADGGARAPSKKIDRREVTLLSPRSALRVADEAQRVLRESPRVYSFYRRRMIPSYRQALAEGASAGRCHVPSLSPVVSRHVAQAFAFAKIDARRARWQYPVARFPPVPRPVGRERARMSGMSNNRVALCCDFSVQRQPIEELGR